MPIGWTDEQDGGYYRLRRRNDEALFGYAVGPHSWKQYQLPAEVKLWRARVDERGALVNVAEPPHEAPRYAFLGARSCELHAIGILDRVLVGGRRSARADAAPTDDPFIVAVQCGVAGGTCFCVSMNTGPVAERGFDLALTEVLNDRPSFRDRGRLGAGRRRARGRPASRGRPRMIGSGELGPQADRVQMGRELDTTDIRSCCTATMSTHGGTRSPRVA